MFQNNRKTILIILLAAFGLALVADLFGASVYAAPPGPPPGGGHGGRPGCQPPAPGQTPAPGYPQCLGAGLEIGGGWQPSNAVPGQPFTYTLNLHDGGVMPATNVELDLQILGDQKFVSFDPGTTGWTLITDPASITNTVRINAGGLGTGQSSTPITITTIYPHVDTAVLRQYANVTWNDANGFGSRGLLLNIPIDLNYLLNPPTPTTPPVSLPSPTPAPTTAGAAPFAAVADPGPGVDGPNNWYFPATSHTLNDQLGFLTYWLSHGAVTVLGFPLSEVYTDPDTGFQSQYFERGVLEYHPTNLNPYKVEIRSLGRELGQVQPAIQASQPPSPGSVFYPQTGHWLDGRFAAFWQSNGGLTQFGYPIGEPTTQADGTVVQWFERARFEYSLSVTGYPQVMLGLVGRESAVKHNYLSN